MNKTVAILVWILVSYLFSSFAHWILGLLTAFIFVPWLKLNLVRSMASGFMVLFLVWFVPAVVLGQRNDGALATMVGDLMSVSSSVLVVATGVIGGIGGALASWLAYSLSTYRKFATSSINEAQD